MRYLAIIEAACILAVSLNTASAMGEEIGLLRSLITSYEDSRIDSNDLAFLLATHNFDAIPRDSYVELNLDGKMYKLIPNGEKPGLCEIEEQS